MARTFGGTLDAVVTDTRGNTLAGINVHAWDAATGGAALGTTVSGPDGSFELTLETTAPGVYVSAGTTGPRRYVPAREAVPDLVTSLANKTNNATTAALSDRVDTTETRVGTVEDELSTGRLSEPALAATLAPVREVAASARARTATDAPTVATIMSCQVDETLATTSCTIAADTVNKKIGSQGIKVTIASAVTAQVRQDYTPALVLSPAAILSMWVYIPDATKITSIGLDLFTTADLLTPGKWGRSSTNLTAPLVNGWNLLRWRASDGLTNLATWPTIYRTRVLVVTNAATDVTIGHVWADCPPKAQVLFIEDRGYKTFKDNGLPDLRDLGIPVTWALDPALNGSQAGTKGEAITDADVAAFAAAGDSISFHAYDGAVTATMTADQIRVDTLKAIRWLQQRGYPGRIWRAAWTQNSAPQHAAAQPYVLAYATASSNANLESWPFMNRYAVGRWVVHGKTQADMDTMFYNLQQTHQVLVCYTHGIHADGGADSTPAEWDYFVSKLREGVEGGWVEGVTFEDLFARSGGKFTSGLGTVKAEYQDASGTVVRQEIL